MATPDRVWAGDATHIATHKARLSLAMGVDLLSSKVLGVRSPLAGYRALLLNSAQPSPLIR